MSTRLRVVFICLCWSVAAVAGEGPNLIQNGNFDSEGEGKSCPFAGWYGRSGQGGQYNISRAAGRSGNAAKIDGTKAGRGDIHCEDFVAKAGDTLVVRFWAKAENLKGGVFATMEGEPGDNWHKFNIDTTDDWKRYEATLTVPQGAKGQPEPKLNIWFYNFGTGAVLIDDVSAAVVTVDPLAVVRAELERIGGWLKAAGTPQAAGLVPRVEEALKSPRADLLPPIRRDAVAALSALHGGDGAFALGVASNLEKVFLDEPFQGRFPKSMQILLGRNESEAAQLVVLAGGDLKSASVELAADLKGDGGTLAKAAVRIDLIGFVDTTSGKRPYKSPKLGWWPDPLLPAAPFDVKAGEAQPLLVTVTVPADQAPGIYSGELQVKVGGAKKAAMPLSIEVAGVTLPQRLKYRTFALGCSAETIAKYYGGDPDQKIMIRFIEEACRRRLPPVGNINGWKWKVPKAAKKADGTYDFAELDRWLDLLKAGNVNAFPMIGVPRFRKFGGGDYTEQFKKDFGEFAKSYAAHLKQRGLFECALGYNIDEASNSEKLREWDACKEMYAVLKAAVPDLPVIQCLNEYKGVQALSAHADIWDLYFGQYEQAGGPAQMKAGKDIFLSVCIWPSEHPNLFVEYPLLDARVMPWICFRTGAKGSEYWDLVQGWDENANNRDWWKSGIGTRTAWKMAKPHADGLLMYPGPDGTPLSSLRLESFRDGAEDFEYLSLLSDAAKTKPEAAELLNEATKKLVTGVTSYDPNPDRLLDLRARILRFLEKK